MHWPHLLAYTTGRVDRELLVRNEYLAAENRILRAKIKGRLRLIGRGEGYLGRNRPPAAATANSANAWRPRALLSYLRLGFGHHWSS